VLFRLSDFLLKLGSFRVLLGQRHGPILELTLGHSNGGVHILNDRDKHLSFLMFLLSELVLLVGVVVLFLLKLSGKGSNSRVDFCRLLFDGLEFLFKSFELILVLLLLLLGFLQL
jgi:hypothetical protein